MIKYVLTSSMVFLCLAVCVTDAFGEIQQRAKTSQHTRGPSIAETLETSAYSSIANSSLNTNHFSVGKSAITTAGERSLAVVMSNGSLALQKDSISVVLQPASGSRS